MDATVSRHRPSKGEECGVDGGSATSVKDTTVLCAPAVAIAATAPTTAAIAATAPTTAAIHASQGTWHGKTTPGGRNAPRGRKSSDMLRRGTPFSRPRTNSDISMSDCVRGGEMAYNLYLPPGPVAPPVMLAPPVPIQPPPMVPVEWSPFGAAFIHPNTMWIPSPHGLYVPYAPPVGLVWVPGVVGPLMANAPPAGNYPYLQAGPIDHLGGPSTPMPSNMNMREPQFPADPIIPLIVQIQHTLPFVPLESAPVHEPPFSLPRTPRKRAYVIAINVEYVATGPKHTDRAVGLIALADEMERTFLNIYVKPDDPVFSYLTPHSSLTKAQLDEGISLDDASDLIRKYLPTRCRLVGFNTLQAATCAGLRSGVDYEQAVDLKQRYRMWNAKYNEYSIFAREHLAKTLLGWDDTVYHELGSRSIINMRLYYLCVDLERDGAQRSAAFELVMATKPLPSFAQKNPSWEGVCTGNRRTCSCKKRGHRVSLQKNGVRE